MAIVRVKPDVAATVHDETTGMFIALRPGAEFDDNDPFVKANRWAFQSDATTDARPRAVAASVEQASANPGELRKTRR